MDIQDSNDTCCKNCRFYEERNGFCRLNPPIPTQTYVKSVGNVITSVWPKIPLPGIDFCSHFESNQLS